MPALRDCCHFRNIIQDGRSEIRNPKQLNGVMHAAALGTCYKNAFVTYTTTACYQRHLTSFSGFS